MVTDILTLQLLPGNEKGSKKDRNRIIDFINGSEFSLEPTIAIMLANIDTSLANKSSKQLSTSKKVAHMALLSGLVLLVLAIIYLLYWRHGNE